MNNTSAAVEHARREDILHLMKEVESPFTLRWRIALVELAMLSGNLPEDTPEASISLMHPGGPQ